MACKDCQSVVEFYERFEDGIPYDEEVFDGYVVRRFSEDIPDHYLKWHWDEEDRIVTPLHDTDWRFQFDNELPFRIADDIYINKGRYHRLIKGTGDLKIMIYREIR